jgi:hypothetical protein
MADTSIWSKFPAASWEVEGKKITFPAEQIEENGGNRLAKHKRMYRDGARLDDTGGEPKEWSFVIPFFNSEDHEAAVDGLAQYPDNADALCDSFDKHECGTLTTPTRGPRRCRAATYRRVDKLDEKDSCVIVATWLEDSEDDERAQTYSGPSAKSQLYQAVEQMSDAASDLGAWNDDLSSLQDFASDLVGMAEAPGQWVDDMDAKANAFANRCGDIEEAFSGAAERGATEGQMLLTDPSSSFAGRKLREAADLVASLSAQKFGSGQPNVTTRTWDRLMTIFDVAIEVKQDSAELIALNGSLPDMLAIAANTPVRIFED